jgi:hypothetical protein
MLTKCRSPGRAFVVRVNAASLAARPKGVSMRYMLVIAGDESRFADWSEEDRNAQLQLWSDYSRALADAGAYVSGEGLQTSTTATTLRMKDGERLLTDGPFAETKEQIGGYYVIECKDLDEALDWAAKMPSAQGGGASEVRPVMDYAAVGAEPPVYRGEARAKKYVLLLWGDESAWESWTPEQMQQQMKRWEEYDREARAAGALMGGEGLEPSTAAKTVRLQDGERLVTDGPFAETKEQLGGFYLLDCKDLDEALDWAAKVPVPDEEPVEVRPVMDYGDRYEDPTVAREGTAS